MHCNGFMHCNSFLQPTEDMYLLPMLWRLSCWALGMLTQVLATDSLPPQSLSFSSSLHSGNSADLSVLPSTESPIEQITIQKRAPRFLATMSSPAAQATELLNSAFPGRVTTPDLTEAFAVERERPWSVLVLAIETIIFATH